MSRFDDKTWMLRRVPIWPGAPSAQKVRKHAIQDGKGCAIAEVATIAGQPYARVKEAAFNHREEGLGGMRPDRIVELIRIVTGERWEYRKSSWWRPKALDTATFPVSPIIAHIFSSKIKPLASHAIVVSMGRVMDSNYEESFPMNEYPQADWMLLGYLAPAHA